MGSLVLLTVTLGWGCCWVVPWKNKDVFPAVHVGTVIKLTRNNWESVLIALVWMGL